MFGIKSQSYNITVISWQAQLRSLQLGLRRRCRALLRACEARPGLRAESP